VSDEKRESQNLSSAATLEKSSLLDMSDSNTARRTGRWTVPL